MKRKYRWEIFFVALTTLAMISLYFLVVPFLEYIELKAWDLHFKQRGAVSPSGKIAFVTIDDESVSRQADGPGPDETLPCCSMPCRNLVPGSSDWIWAFLKRISNCANVPFWM